MKGLILCGGLGTRLRPITYSLPKQLIPIANRPVIFYIIDSLVSAGINNIGIVVNDNEFVFKEMLKEYNNNEVTFEFIRQRKPLGLANAVYLAKDFINQDDFVMILGDNLYEVDIEDFINKFKRDSLNSRILLKEVKEPKRFGIAKTIDGKLVDLIEKPKNPPSNLAITGVYIFDNNIFDACKNIDKSQRGEYEITDAIKWLIDNKYKVGFDILNGWWRDLGKPTDILDANNYKLNHIRNEIKGIIDEKSVVSGKIILGENSKIYNSVIRGPVVIGNNSIIENSYIGPYSSISNQIRIINSEIENSIILDSCYIENIDKVIDSSIIERNCTIINKGFHRKVNSFVLGKNSKVIIN